VTNFKPVIHPWNEVLWQSLMGASERRNHALLFTGSRGLGKIATGFALAQNVLCDGQTQSITLFDAGSHPDLHVLMPEDKVLELDGADLLGSFANRYLEPNNGKPKRLIGIEQVRKLGLALTTHPHIANTRIVLVVCAESMNRNAANALLKNLEEPPANTLFIVISDEISKLPKTIRSRCSLVNFRAPELATAKAWLEQQQVIPSNEIENHLAMANNHPLLAESLYKSGYIESLKSVFTDVNGLWNQRREAVEVAKNWQTIGGLKCLDILQKLSVDLLRFNLSNSPKSVYFPVQSSWVSSVSAKISLIKLHETIDLLAESKKLLSTSVDELLVLETLSVKFTDLPQR